MEISRERECSCAAYSQPGARHEVGSRNLPLVCEPADPERLRKLFTPVIQRNRDVDHRQRAAVFVLVDSPQPEDVWIEVP